jgi:predicted O-methyltransferase YrrM
LVPASRLLRNGPRALATGLARLLFGYRPEQPWISYDAQAVLARHLGPESRVLEFGSGMSTVWFASRAGYVVSLEHDRHWYELIGRRLERFGNVEYRHVEDADTYLAQTPDEQFDLIVIDGRERLVCAVFAMTHRAPGGIIYLDNSDKFPEPRELLLGFARKRALAVREFIDFAPTQLFVQRGLMVGG